MQPIHPQANQVINKLIQGIDGTLSTFPFPDNIAGTIPQSIRQAIYRWMLKNYIWPQIQERKIYEPQWDKLLQMARAALKISSINNPGEDTRLGERFRTQERKLDGEEPSTAQERLEISDTVIYDAIDRLTNLNHFIGFKEDLPVRYEIPQDMVFPNENDSYSPMSDLVRAGNCWLKFNSQSQNVYRKGYMAAKHHYTYGVSFVDSQYQQKIQPVMRRQADKTFVEQLELVDIGITFEPMSIRKLWLNPRISIHDMGHQACPFFFEQMPRFAIVANSYNAETNPFGFANTERLPNAQYLFGTPELESTAKAWELESGTSSSLSLLAPEFNVEMLWTFYAMLPLGIDDGVKTEENPQGIVFDEDGSLNIPLSRWIVQTFGNNLTGGGQEIVKLQRNFYPNDMLPLYGSAHMPSLDDGAYPMAIGSILENHYTQICKCIMQFLENKDWCNDPPAFVVTSSPANAHKLNVKGSKIPVLSQGDVRTREPFDNTQTTPAFMAIVREQAQTSSKAVDAVLGKAMGSRTSATEASNIFQTAMSGVTTDINLFTYDIYGGYADRVWLYTGHWVDPDVLAAITGGYGFAIKPEHMLLKMGLKWDIGSSFIESLTRQSNYRYLLESSQPGDPSINRAYLMKSLLREWKMKDVDKIINDGGMENNIQSITTDTIQTYLGENVVIDPSQNHQLAIQIKMSFLKDRKSVWNSNPQWAANGQKLVPQIQQHQLFLQLQMQQQQLQMEQQMLRQESVDSLQSLQNGSNPGRSTSTGGQQAQDVGGKL